ncbi:hypothetical protein T492DRAFT_1063461 [Pavlovales sp. CCMP2436]|nr:hypothetical protein T492DRAFT_1063461 [Pavlovales sp. CCMP2436]|mmetsp:Transcript_35863/g.89492  ORF Transcript_35863/g.89492 Transcript_35863/m.89492 type:complete len:441 (+) Transcript_35863:185-1507(+)
MQLLELPATDEANPSAHGGGGGADAAEARTAWWCMFLLNMAVLWSFQSLLAAQDLYEAKYPSAHLAFVGTVSFSVAMVVGQALVLATGVGERADFGVRLVPGFVAFALVGAALLARPSAEAITFGFALTGVLNCLTEAPLYAIAAQCWQDDSLTAALNMGNGAAGAVNISMLALIRAGTEAARMRRGEVGSAAARLISLELSNQLFLSLMVAINLAAVLVYLRLMCLPSISSRVAARQAETRNRPGSGMLALLLTPCSAVRAHCAPYAAAWPHVRLACHCQLFIFVSTLALWPGIACASAPTGWFALHPAWYCSPFVIFCFNASDFAGRLLAGLPSVRDKLPLRRCAQLTAVRVLLALPIGLAARPRALFASSEIVALAVVALGLSNGLLATRTMCIGPQLAPKNLRGAAAGLTVLALYSGIGLGAVLGLAYGEVVLFRS